MSSASLHQYSLENDVQMLITLEESYTEDEENERSCGLPLPENTYLDI